ncbi:RnfH family protein [Lysobacter sp. N42]|jgi:putative ubiquitin-RnfH superfamily antitoxin RatB of RatAB toxin-antitoxin module|uniref:RnfH family protein n=1 Tax=Lysobacter sp. N42 TaxID=2545719 RepID=UPI0010452925|nr:RnfH family protein [Lysobacter sp. N42]TCZ88374.1 RnfH family protein [Lysobacter sp. N42]
MEVEVIRAWPRRFEAVRLQLPEGATVGDAVDAAGWSGDAGTVAYAVFGQRAGRDTPLRAGDRVELLRPLLADPKDARRRRAAARGR